MSARDARQERRVALFIWGSTRLGGAERRFFRLFDHLRKSGCNIDLYTSESGAAACKALDIDLDGARVRVLAEPDKKGPRLLLYGALLIRALRLVGQLRRDRIAHLHFGENPGALSFLYGFLARFACPFSVSLVDSIGNYRRSFRQRLFVVVTARFAARIDCLSAQIKQDLVSFLDGRYESKCLVSPCSFTDPKRALAARADQRRDIDIALISRMIPGKGHRLLRDALLAVERAGRSGLVVHVCGAGPLEQEIRREFQAIEQQHVKIYFEDEPFAVMLRTKVYVSLQDVENYPSQSLLEAMTCGCAIVATDVGLTRQLLDETCAVLVPRDGLALATAVQRLLDGESLRAELGKNAKEVVASKHSIDRFAAYFIAGIFGRESCTG